MMGLPQSTYQRKRREAGLCGWGGCHEFTGDDSYYCPAHGRQVNDRRNARRVAATAVRQAKRAAKKAKKAADDAPRALAA